MRVWEIRKDKCEVHVCFRVEEGREVLRILRFKNYPSEAEVNTIKGDVDANTGKVG